MNDTLSFVAHGLPKGQPRARAFARKMGAKFVARMYDAGTADEWKHNVAEALLARLLVNDWQRTEEPVHVAIVFVMPRPKSHTRENGSLRDSAPRFHKAKPDIDNLVKLVFDVITRSERVWHDDSQVIACLAEKKYAASNERSGAIVTISSNSAEALMLPTYRLQRPQS